jgi:hypothetical protein
VQAVLDKMALTNTSSCSLLRLSRHLASLLAILSGKRGQTIHKIDLSDIIVSANILHVKPPLQVKQSRPGHKEMPITIPAFPNNKNLCVINTLKCYLLATKSLRKEDTRLFIGAIAPHKPVSRSTLSRWVKNLLHEAGVDASFSAASTRGAATSASTAPLATIMAAAGWAKESTFRQFYQLPVAQSTTFAASLLDPRKGGGA